MNWKFLTLVAIVSAALFALSYIKTHPAVFTDPTCKEKGGVQVRTDKGSTCIEATVIPK